MVDLKTNTVYFGYGDVVVSGNFAGGMIFANINPPSKCGYVFDGKDYEYTTRLKVEEDHVFDLYNLFLSVTPGNQIVTYHGVTFDFTNYNAESVKVCREQGFRTVCLAALTC